MASNVKWGFILLEMVTAVTCCLGNVLVIWAVWSCGALKKPTFCFITSLAVADFLVGIVAVPLSVLVEVQMKTSFHGCLFMCCALLMLQITSVMLLLAIAVDRCLRVQIPLRYKSTVTQKRSWMVVALCWFIAAVWGFFPVFGWTNQNIWDISAQNNTNSTSFECKFLSVMPISYLVNVIFFSSLLPPLAIMTGLYCYIFLTIRRQLRAHISEATVSITNYHKEHKLAVSLALVVVLFAVCWLPIFIMHTVRFYGHNITVPSIMIDTGILLSHANSAFNPIVYAFRIHKIKEACKKLWGRFYCGRGDHQVGDQNDANSSRNSNAKNSGATTHNTTQSDSEHRRGCRF